MWQELLPSSLIKALGGSGGAGGGAENHQSQGGWRGGRLVVENTLTAIPYLPSGFQRPWQFLP